MKTFDRMLQRWRIEKAKRYIPDKSRVLDIGCFQGELFETLHQRGVHGIGIDPLVERKSDRSEYELIKGYFPQDLSNTAEKFDVITALAVFEHIPNAERLEFASNCSKLLKPGGRIILTVPSKRTDRLLSALLSLHVIDGMSLEEHQDFNPAELPEIFQEAGLRLVTWKKFQLGFNNFFVFIK